MARVRVANGSSSIVEGCGRAALREACFTYETSAKSPEQQIPVIRCASHSCVFVTRQTFPNPTPGFIRALGNCAEGKTPSQCLHKPEVDCFAQVTSWVSTGSPGGQAGPHAPSSWLSVPPDLISRDVSSRRGGAHGGNKPCLLGGVRPAGWTCRPLSCPHGHTAGRKLGVWSLRTFVLLSPPFYMNR